MQMEATLTLPLLERYPEVEELTRLSYRRFRPLDHVKNEARQASPPQRYTASLDCVVVLHMHMVLVLPRRPRQRDPLPPLDQL